MNLASKARHVIHNGWLISTRIAIEVAKRVLPDLVQKQLRALLKRRYQKYVIQARYQFDALLASLQKGRDYRTIIIFPPSLDWNVQLFQRPQQLARACARRGALVFYLQPQPNLRYPPFELLNERLYLCNVLVDTFHGFPHPIIYLLTWNSDYADLFNDPYIIYDYVDNVDVFYGDRGKIVQGHRNLLRSAEIVLATARKLVEETQNYRADVLYIPNGVEYEHFARFDQGEEPVLPTDLEPLLALEQPIIGYYGALARWFDYDLLKEVALLRPNYTFLLIGPDYDGTLTHAGLSAFSNIHWLGVKPYQDLPYYLHYFDVATIPFVVNEVTHAVSPLKLFEYMAGGKPIVITPMQESMHYPGVLVGDTPQAFAGQLDIALNLRNDQAYLKQLRKTALKNTWDSRAEVILQAIEARSKPPVI